jgi:hypothetical protein
MIVHDEIRYAIVPTNVANVMTFRKNSKGVIFRFKIGLFFNSPLLSLFTTENYPLSFKKSGNTYYDFMCFELHTPVWHNRTVTEIYIP